MGEAEGAVVHGDHPARVQVDEGLGGVGGTGVDVAEGGGIVGSDGKESEFGGEAFPDFAEAGEIGGVSGVIDGVLAGADDVASVTAVRVFEDAGSPVARGDVGDFESAFVVAVPPLEFDDLLEAEVGDEVEDVVRDDERGRGAGLAAGLAGDGPQRLAVEMVEVGVRDEDDVHGRKVAETQAGLAKTFEDKEPAGEVGVDDDVAASDLEEEAGMSNEGDAEFSVRDQPGLVGFSRARGDDGVTDKAGKLAGTLA